MAETKLNVTLLAHTRLADDFNHIEDSSGFADFTTMTGEFKSTDGAMVALTAVRTCYSPLRPTEILPTEGEKYFGREASDGAGGTDADRLLRHIVNSKHTSTLEHITFTFAIEGVSRALLAQLTRHRHFSFSVQSQRYVRFGSDDKSGGFDYVVPPSVKESEQAWNEYFASMENAQDSYDDLRAWGVPPEDARLGLPNAAATNLVMTANLRSLLEFYAKRSEKAAQWEIRALADALKDAVVAVEPWTAQFFEKAV